MPELPDLAGYRRLLAREVRRIQRIEVLDGSILRDVSAARLEAALRGRRVDAVERRGKWLAVRVEGGAAMVVHLGMTGAVVDVDDREPRSRADRLLVADRRELRLRDVRKLSRVWLAADSSAVDRIIPVQGPDAARLSTAVLTERLRGRRGAIKTALRDQAVVAGLGNTLTDEVLWRARIHPARPVAALAPAEITCLHMSIRDALTRSVRAGHIPRTRGRLTSQRDSNTPRCPRCREPLARSAIGGRTALWCPLCQPR